MSHRKLYRAANDAIVMQGTSFASLKSSAREYLDNLGFGGSTLYVAEIEVDSETVLDARGMDVDAVAEMLGMASPGAIGVDEWIGRSVAAQEAARAAGYLWVIVDESYPVDTTTWIWVGESTDDEPEMEECEST